MPAAVILPSRNEPLTISAVTTAVDLALNDAHGVIVHADSSDGPDTADAFAATPTRAKTLVLTGLERGKGAQILAALQRPEIVEADVVLIADTDTRAPEPGVYRALLDHVRAGAALAIADYPRYWDEANLTNHVARPMIAAATGLDIPQPLAGDLAVSGRALAAAQHAAVELPDELARCVAGYGIDAFLLLTAATTGLVTSVPVKGPKRHAGSFDHLPAIYDQAVPVLLHLTATWPLPPAPARSGTGYYRATDRTLPSGRVREMVAVLNRLDLAPGRYDGDLWPLHLGRAWRAVTSGTPPTEAAVQLWPHYVRRVRAWLTSAEHATPRQRARMLAAAHNCLCANLRSTAGAA
ncbi:MULTISPECIES: hypothetical protein [unclassified Streptomyces]|uniref:hypothetical protein n=1 Tax=unclassified Streptomyces TaxID=2593676 RepID=UPI000DADCE82|nr:MULTISPECIES: hypothetical protein [unclassified Streptomyces]PZT77939.1 hypothetical protein DNK56_20145 [Streptomyces sp. AC1-42W]PZT80684.1 hypothetical protein DNK55_12540 [Streptomyces sp. AC1-42T]